jgi:hypothetical protein
MFAPRAPTRALPWTHWGPKGDPNPLPILDCHCTYMREDKIMRIDNNTEPIVLGDGALENVTELIYLGNVVDTSGGTDKDIRVRIRKAKTGFNMLKKIWNAREISTKIRIFNSNVKAVLFYGAETWRTTVASSMKIQSFINRCLRRILRIFLPN